MMDATATVILVSIFVLGALLIALPRALDRRHPRAMHDEGDDVDVERAT